VEGLTDAQLDWDDVSQEWAKWSIRRQVSHVAMAYYFQMLLAWGKHFFKDRQQPGAVDLTELKAVRKKYDRVLDEEKFWELEDILPQVEFAINIAREILSRLDERDLESITAERIVPPDATFTTSNENMGDYFERASKCHPDGIERDTNDPTVWHTNAKYIFRHMIWETLTHLNTIQRLKKAQGLPARVAIPKVGYLTDPWFSGE
jgi:hypothetical protein